jgi:hypothetical protein
VLRAVILDKDYRCSEELDDTASELRKNGFYVVIHRRKELENYLLQPAVLSRAAEARTLERAKRSGATKAAVPDIKDMLASAMEEVRHATFAQLQARELEYRKRRNSGLDQATITAAFVKLFENEWATEDGRIALVPGKEVLAKLNSQLQAVAGVSVSDGQIAQQFRTSEIPVDIQALVEGLVEFCNQEPPNHQSRN